MKHNAKFGFIAGAALALVGSAQASYHNNDLLVGFDGNSSDFIYDLGQYSTLTYGETWTVGANLGTDFGVIGASANAASLIYVTSPSVNQNNFAQGNNYQNTKANVALAAGLLTGAGQSRTTAPSDTTGWTYLTDQPSGTPGNTFFNNYYNPNVSTSSSAYFFVNSANETAGVLTGVFTYNSSTGILTYNRPPASAPAQVTLSISTTNVSTNFISTISFPSASGVTYTLYYTNSAGLSAYVSNWPSLPTTISGDGTTKSFMDTNNTSSTRFYSVGEH
jgi:hypothetical protein